MNVWRLIDNFDAYFRSGNDVPVVKAHIPKAEWDRLKAAIEEALKEREPPL